jgi:ATP-binding cassette subfamily F protein 3
VTQLAVAGVSVEFGATRLLDDVTFTVTRGERWAVIGRNGSGKTTLFRLLAGQQDPSIGSVARAAGLRISVVEQQREFAGARTVWEAAAGGFADLLALEGALGEQAAALARAGDACTPEMLARYDRDLERFEREGGYTLTARIDAVLHGLGFDPAEARVRPLEGLSGGERGRVALVQQLVAPGDILLLDEPTNHLDLETTCWLEGYLQQLDATVLLISHDRAFLQAVVDHVLHLEGGSAVAYSGDYESFLRQRAERRLSRQRAFSKQTRVIAAEEDYIRRNIAGGNSAQARGRRRRLERVSRLSPPPGDDGVMALHLTADVRSGEQVIVAERVHLEMNGRRLLEDFSARIERGDVIGLVGPNGAGKSTFLRIVCGERAPDSGAIRVPGSVSMSYYRQDLGQVPPDRTLYDIIADLRPSWGRGPIQGHLGRFGFSGDSVQRRAGTLSGGERARVALAMMMLHGANFLIFDEPTNHLDVESIEALEDAISEYAGTVLLVSHDRALLRALTTRVWILHGARITDFPGSFTEWETASAERAHAAAVAAAEDEPLRKVQGRKQTHRPDQDRKRRQSARRQAERALAEAEARVADCETRVAAFRRELEDPELYLTVEGASRARELGKRLDEARLELEQAFDDWAAATRSVETG